MKNLKKKIFAVLLTITVSVPVLISVFFLANQQIIRHRMFERLEEERSHTVTVPATSVNWIKKNKEILVGGKMFDVKSFRKEGDQYFFSGLFDDDETALNRLLDTGISHHNKNTQGILVYFFQWLHMVYPDFRGEGMITLPETGIKKKILICPVSTGYKSVLHPPPEA